jgi:hypothetical protein
MTAISFVLFSGYSMIVPLSLPASQYGHAFYELAAQNPNPEPVDIQGHTMPPHPAAFYACRVAAE